MEENNPRHKAQTRKRRLIAFGYYGGKFSLLKWLLPLLPTDYNVIRHYCEPFGGSASVILNRPPAPVETYNDIDGEVVNFFRVLRDDTDALIKAISLTPFSREEFVKACEADPTLDPLERARRFYVRARQVYLGLAQTATPGRWAYTKHDSRRGMAGNVARWLGSVEKLPEIAERLLRVQIENRPALQVIHTYDTPDTLFYCDPPYIHATRTDAHGYAYEMDDEEHRQLAAALNEVKGFVAISSYDCREMDELYPSPRWMKTVAPTKSINSTKARRTEALWTNYDPVSLRRLPA